MTKQSPLCFCHHQENLTTMTSCTDIFFFRKAHSPSKLPERYRRRRPSFLTIPRIRSQSRGKSLPTPPSPSPRSPIASCGRFDSSEFQRGTRQRQGELERPQCSAKRWLPRFGEFCSCCCLSLLPGFPCGMHATWGPPFSPPMYILEWPSRGLVRSLSFPSPFLSLLWPTFLSVS